jgi:hypothetical protein
MSLGEIVFINNSRNKISVWLFEMPRSAQRLLVRSSAPTGGLY